MEQAKVVSLKFRKRLLTQDGPVDFVYFPIQSMISLLVTTEDEPPTEMATVGCEGVVGAQEAACGQGALGEHLVQVSGMALRVPAKFFSAELAQTPELAQLLQRYQYALMRQILQGAACNRMHSMEERCARWLLLTRDKAGSDTFPLTQEFLSHMLGVRRASVNVATGMLKKAGFIKYVRGRITILDRPGLESAACECYSLIKQAYESAMGSSS